MKNKKKIVRCIDADRVATGIELVKDNWYIAESVGDALYNDDYYNVYVNGYRFKLLKSRFVDVAHREVISDVQATSEQLEDTDRYKTTSGKQLFDVMKDDLMTPEQYAGFLTGNIYKYVKRYKQKNGVDDLKKAKVYLNELIKLEETENEKSI